MYQRTQSHSLLLIGNSLSREEVCVRCGILVLGVWRGGLTGTWGAAGVMVKVPKTPEVVEQPFRHPLRVSISCPGITRHPQVHCGRSMEERFFCGFICVSVCVCSSWRIHPWTRQRDAMMIKLKKRKKEKKMGGAARRPFFFCFVLTKRQTKWADNIRQLTSARLGGPTVSGPGPEGLTVPGTAAAALPFSCSEDPGSDAASSQVFFPPHYLSITFLLNK